jgi:hypothetical protein
MHVWNAKVRYACMSYFYFCMHVCMCSLTCERACVEKIQYWGAILHARQKHQNFGSPYPKQKVCICTYLERTAHVVCARIQGMHVRIAHAQTVVLTHTYLSIAGRARRRTIRVRILIKVHRSSHGSTTITPDYWISAAYSDIPPAVAVGRSRAGQRHSVSKVAIRRDSLIHERSSCVCPGAHAAFVCAYYQPLPAEIDTDTPLADCDTRRPRRRRTCC